MAISNPTFYETVRGKLSDVFAMVDEIYRLLYDYRKALSKEIEIYNEYSEQDKLIYVLTRATTRTIHQKILPWEITHLTIRDTLNQFISGYEVILRIHYPQQLQAFAESSALLSAQAKNLDTVFNTDYLDNPPLHSPIKYFEESLKKIQTSIKRKAEVIDGLLSKQETSDAKGPQKVPFISKGFADKERGTNEYFEKLLDSLGITFTTGEPYSTSSIPDKIRAMIQGSNLLIAIVQRRYGDRTQGVGSSWIIREMTYASTIGKPLIIIAQEGVDLAGFPMEEEIIYFNKIKSESLEQATMKFLEALCEHGLIKRK